MLTGQAVKGIVGECVDVESRIGVAARGTRAMVHCCEWDMSGVGSSKCLTEIVELLHDCGRDLCCLKRDVMLLEHFAKA